MIDSCQKSHETRKGGYAFRQVPVVTADLLQRRMTCVALQIIIHWNVGAYFDQFRIKVIRLMGSNLGPSFCPTLLPLLSGRWARDRDHQFLIEGHQRQT